MKDIGTIQERCRKILDAYKSGLLGDQTMPEDTHPKFNSQEDKLVFFTLPMALNYQRNSYTLWQAATKTFNDSNGHLVFSTPKVAKMDVEKLRHTLLTHRLALQPNKHVVTWQTIAQTVADNWGSIENMLKAADHDFLKLQNIIQKQFKKGFPYLSGPKIFHYWCLVLGEYCGVKLKNREFIQIAPDNHVIQCSIRLGVITDDEATSLDRDVISERWRLVLSGTGIAPIDLHSPLWFWSRNGFIYTI